MPLANTVSPLTRSTYKPPRAPSTMVGDFLNQKAAAKVYGITLDPGAQAQQAITGATVNSGNPYLARQAAYTQQLKEHSKWGQKLNETLALGRVQQQTPGAVATTGSSAYTGGGGDATAQALASRVGGVRGQILNAAVGMIGTPYAWGGGGIGVRSSRGTGKGTENVIGVDCSGLTSYVYGLYGIRLPRTANAQSVTGVRTNINNAKPGDLVGWAKGGHIAIYMGDGYILHSPQPGKTVTTRKLFQGEQVFAVSLNIPGEVYQTPQRTQQYAAPAASSGRPVGINDVQRYLAGLRRAESGGNYASRSRYSSASGAYQYIKSTWNNYGGYAEAWQAPPAVQDRRAMEDALALFRRYGNWEQVAAHHIYPAWASNRAMWNRSPGGINPTIQTYVNRVLG